MVWQENVQYVVLRNVTVAAGQTATITVKPGGGGYALISGMQNHVLQAGLPATPAGRRRADGLLCPTMAPPPSLQRHRCGKRPLGLSGHHVAQPWSADGHCSKPDLPARLGLRRRGRFTFKANDGNADSAPATVSIIVLGMNRATLINVQFCAAFAIQATFKNRKSARQPSARRPTIMDAYSRDGAGGTFLTYGFLTNLKGPMAARRRRFDGRQRPGSLEQRLL